MSCPNLHNTVLEEIISLPLHCFFYMSSLFSWLTDSLHYGFSSVYGRVAGQVVVDNNVILTVNFSSQIYSRGEHLIIRWWPSPLGACHRECYTHCHTAQTGDSFSLGMLMIHVTSVQMWPIVNQVGVGADREGHTCPCVLQWRVMLFFYWRPGL